MKFILFVEGETEKNTIAAFLKRWLDPRLTQPVGIQVILSNGYAELARKIVTKAKLHLEGPKKKEIIAVVGLLDLYGPNDLYPPELETAQKRYEWGVKHFEQEVGHDRFRMFFAVHEYEAWLLSDPEIFPHSVKDALLATTAQPEQVNFNEPPAKLLDKIYKQKIKRGYKKVVYGKQLFAKLDPAIAVSKCPYLKTMLEEMLSLAKNAGQ